MKRKRIVSSHLALACFCTALAAGCATPDSGGVRTYQQGIPMAPRAPAFNPMADAPHTVGQPGHVAREHVPRTASTRILPETPETRREAGIWASGLPTAKEEWPVFPSILGVPLPLPVGAKTNDERYYARKCGRHMHRLADAESPDAGDAFSEAARRCLAARLYRACMDAEDAALLDGAHDASFAQYITATRAVAAAFMKSACATVPRDATVDGIVEKLSRLYTTAARKGGTP